jgi:hypothetical protein
VVTEGVAILENISGLAGVGGSEDKARSPTFTHWDTADIQAFEGSFSRGQFFVVFAHQI